MPDRMTIQDKAEVLEPIEQVLAKGHGEVTVTVKITDHKIVNVKFSAQYELRK